MDGSSLTERDREVLNRSVLCAAMNDTDTARILGTGTLQTFERNRYVFQQGDLARRLYIILDGWVQISREEADGMHTLIATFHSGDSLAEAPAFLKRPYPVSAQAMTDLRILAVDGDALMDIMQQNRTVLAQSLASIYHKLHDLVDDLEWIKSRTIRERLARFLLNQMQNARDGEPFPLPYRKSLIAAKIGTSPQQLSRTFAELQDFGVRIDGQTAIIASAEMLQRVFQKG
jgi:CRP-like cAMP-binding protein